MPFLVLILLFLSISFHAYDARSLRDFQTPNSIFIQTKADHHHVSYLGYLHEKKTSSKEIINDFYFHEGVKIKGLEMKKRLIMEEEHARNEPEKVMKFEEDEVGEDMVVMDYAQPHRKPPIHNENNNN